MEARVIDGCMFESEGDLESVMVLGGLVVIERVGRQTYVANRQKDERMLLAKDYR